MYNNANATIVPVELLKKYDRPGPRYTSYPTAPNWSEEIGIDEYKKAISGAAGRTDQYLALYCHIPFCRRRCFYCGCNTCVVKNDSSVDDYINIMINEINNTADFLSRRNKISQLHFGGGTPTFLDVAGLRKILDAFDSRFEFMDRAEKSIELDPRVTTIEQLDFLASRGFNRASLGVQTFDPKVQKAIGRIQSEDQVRIITDRCRQLNFKGINFDIIYGLPMQSEEIFERTLEQAIQLRPDRLAVYSFAYLPKLRAHQSKINADDLPSTEVKYSLFAKAIQMLTRAGYRQIGMDHFALPDDELAQAQSDARLNRNFMGYTVQKAPEMIGLGMSSIGYINNSFFQNFSKLDSYKNRINDEQFAVYRGLKLSEDDLKRQYTITSLMCNFVVKFDDFKKSTGAEYHSYFASENKELQQFIEDGFVEIMSDRLKITELGRTFVRNIAMIFDAYLKQNDKNKKTTFSRTI